MKGLAEEVGGPIEVEEEEEEGEEGGGTTAAATHCSSSSSSSSSRSNENGVGRGEDKGPEHEEGGLEEEGPAAGVAEGEGGSEDVAGHLA